MVQSRGGLSAHSRDALEDKHRVTPGPDDMTVLYLQDQHWSEDIWNEQGGDPVTIRQPHRVYDLDERARLFVIAYGYYEIGRIHGINIDHILISTLVERWRRETHTFHLRVEEMTPTLQDVAMLTGVPINGAPVTGPGGTIDPDDLCLRLLERVPPRNAYRSESLKLIWLANLFQIPPDEAIEDQLIMHA